MRGHVFSLCTALSFIPLTPKGVGGVTITLGVGRRLQSSAQVAPKSPGNFHSSLSLTGAFMLSLPSAVWRLLSPELGTRKAGSWSQDMRETEAREETNPGQGKWVQEPKALKSPSM